MITNNSIEMNIHLNGESIDYTPMVSVNNYGNFFVLEFSSAIGNEISYFLTKEQLDLFTARLMEAYKPYSDGHFLDVKEIMEKADGAN